MSIQVITDRIHRLHTKVLVSTGFQRAFATPEYLQTICRASTLLERDLIEQIMRGTPIEDSIKNKVTELRKFACN